LCLFGDENGLTIFKGIEKFGFNVDAQNNITYREWAPNATQAFLIGDFSTALSSRVANLNWKKLISAR
jgi:1,4-alpha-glucan branching enzyme